MNFYVIGDDKSLMDVTDLVLALAGGLMEGNIGFKGTNANGDMIRFLDNTTDASGNGISIGDGGAAIIGGGESARLLEGELTYAGNERMIIANDQAIEFWVNCQNGLDSAVKVVLQNNGQLSGHQKAITSGTAAPSGGVNGDIYIQY